MTETVNVSLDVSAYDRLQELKREHFGSETGVSHSAAVFYAATEAMDGEDNE